MQKIILVAGARPNFIKIAPLWRAFSENGNVQLVLVHTGQHSDVLMSRVFFDELGLPEPRWNLGATGKSHAKLTASIMTGFDEVLDHEQPDDVVVTGDVNSTLACALVAAKRGIRVSHVEAGSRSFDRSMPEEINRITTDALSDLLFVSEPSGIHNLKQEGINSSKIHFVGNVMIDSLLFAGERIEASGILSRLGINEKSFALVTLHRPSNVDFPERLTAIMKWLESLSRQVTVVFPVHPRTRGQLPGDKGDIAFSKSGSLINMPPLGYYDFHKLLKSAQFVITDSGGIQEETTWLGVPCITLRDNTERPVTVELGTNYLAGGDLKLADSIARDCLAGVVKKGQIPELWDGRVAGRIVDVITNSMNG